MKDTISRQNLLSKLKDYRQYYLNLLETYKQNDMLATRSASEAIGNVKLLSMLINDATFTLE